MTEFAYSRVRVDPPDPVAGRMASKINTEVTANPRRGPWRVKPIEEYWMSRQLDALGDLGATAERRVTARQVFYRLVGAYGYPKTSDAEKRCRTLFAHARWYGCIDWRLVRDPTRSQATPNFWADPDDFMQTVHDTAASYTVDRQRGQQVRIEVRLEANCMLDTVISVCREFGIGWYAYGSSSHTALYEAADRAARSDVPTVMLVVGDLDLAGGHIKDSVQSIVRHLSRRGDLTYIDVAVTPEQVDRYNLPAAPVESGKPLSVQAEALMPQDMEAELRAAITPWVDTSARDATRAREALDRMEIIARLGGGVPTNRQEGVA